MSPLEKPLHIDIPVKLSEVKAVFSVGALAFEGDLPASIFHLQLVSNDTADWNAKAQVIAIFHTNAGHVTLHDSAYNADRNIATGNPYKILLADLMTHGIQVELCGATAKSTSLGKRRLASRGQGQHRCHGENDATRSARVRENHGVKPRPSAEYNLIKKS